MSGMFSGCSSLTSLNLSNFDTSQVTRMFGMFDGCSKLQNITVSASKWVTTKADTTNMFNNCGVSSVTYV